MPFRPFSFAHNAPSSLLHATLTFGHEVTAHGLFGRLRQRGLAIAQVASAARPTVALTAYTQHGPSDSARLEIPISELRQLARVLLDLAEKVEGTTLRPSSASLGDLAELRRAG